MEIDPEDGVVHVNRGETWLHLGEWEKARLDLAVARTAGTDIVASFLNEYASIDEFEQRHGLTLPVDIREMLGD